MGAKQSNPLYPSRALRADPSADDSSVGEDNLSVVVFSNERPHSAESKGGFFNLEHYLRDHERRMSTPERPPGGYLQHDPEPVDENNPDPTQHEYAPSKPGGAAARRRPRQRVVRRGAVRAARELRERRSRAAGRRGLARARRVDKQRPRRQRRRLLDVPKPTG